jgi:hypothetical protein
MSPTSTRRGLQEAHEGAPREASSGVRRLARGNATFLRQGVGLIDRLSDEQFRAGPPVDPLLATARALFQRGAVGAHFRHVLDHYVSFFEGLDGGLVDYDRRSRDRALERDRGLCQGCLGAFVRRLEGLAVDGEEALLLTALGGAAHEGGQAVPGTSSVSRELQFLASHTVHHYAIIAVIARLFGVEPGDEFGVAPSTLEYERGASSCAP